MTILQIIFWNSWFVYFHDSNFNYYLLLYIFSLVKRSDTVIYKDPDWSEVLHKGEYSFLYFLFSDHYPRHNQCIYLIKISTRRLYLPVPCMKTNYTDLECNVLQVVLCQAIYLLKSYFGNYHVIKNN